MSGSLSPLKPGDAIVPLAALAARSAAISGALSIAFLLWRADLHWALVLLGLVAGAIAAGLLGIGIGRKAFPATAGQVFVVLAGRSALPLTLRAAVVPAVIAVVAVNVAGSLLVGAPLLFAVLASAPVAVLVGVVFGYGSALL